MARFLALPAALVLAACSLVVDTNGLSGGPSLDAGPIDDSGTGPDAREASAACDPTADHTKDARACGRCGHDCLGGACEAGVCLPAVAATFEADPYGLATDGDRLYISFTNIGEIRKMALDGGGESVESVVKGLGNVIHLSVDDAFLYWPTLDNKTIQRMPKTGGKVETIVTCAGPCLGTAVAGDTLYFTDRGPNAVLRLPKAAAAGTTPQVVFAGLDCPEDVEVTATTVYVASECQNQIKSAPLGSSTPSIFASIVDVVAVSVDGTDAWAASQSPGIIYRQPLAGGAPVVVASGQQSPTGIVATPTAVFWAAKGGRVFRLVK